MRRIFWFALLAGVVSPFLNKTTAGAQEEPIFKPNSGIVDYYADHREATPMIDKNVCPPGVADVTGIGTPCGSGGGDSPPINPCSAAGSCGPGVGLDSGLIRLPPETWNVEEFLSR